MLSLDLRAPLELQ